jgi:asparagine synthase (glutamine-hydrolysing)
MCGIAGELRFDHGVMPAADWSRISSMMLRRGPDDEGLWTDDPWATLAFRRLAIIDLSQNGHQPMTACDGRYALVFNGEVYNFTELRAQLQHVGWSFRSTSDTEVVLYALIQWGVHALARFNGMFALGFYDRHEKRLILARDHAGMKPLYYMMRPEGVVFASQYDQILAHPLGQGGRVSSEALALYLRLAYIPAPFALLQDSHMLEPGSWIEFTPRGRGRSASFFSFPDQETPALTGEEALDALDSVLTQAVQRHLVSDVPVGAFLSGGIDSPLIVAKMRSLGSNAISAFTIGTDDPETDESKDAVEYARQLQVDHVLERMSPDQALGSLDDVIDACGEPFGDYSIFPTMEVVRLARRNYKVMLSGDGGDELFWGYPGRFGRLLTHATEFGRPYWSRRLLNNGHRALGTRKVPPYLRHRTVGDWHRQMLTHTPEVWLRRVFPTLPEWPTTYMALQNAESEPRRVALRSRRAEYECHLPYVLMKVDRASMHHSLEVRVPFLDRDVIATAAQIDWTDCLQPTERVGKLPLRRLLARYTKHQTHRKRGFEAPMGEWLRTSLRETFVEVVLKRHELLGLEVNSSALARLFEQHQKGERDYARALWPLLSLGLWIDRHCRAPRSMSI